MLLTLQQIYLSRKWLAEDKKKTGAENEDVHVHSCEQRNLTYQKEALNQHSSAAAELMNRMQIGPRDVTGLLGILD